MSWHCLQGQGEFCLESYLDGLRSVRSNSQSIREKSYSNDRETGTSRHSLSGTTSPPSTEHRGEDLSMSSQEDSPVRISVGSVKVKDLPGRVQASGLRCSELLKRYSLGMSSRKTVRTFVPEDLVSSSKDLPVWGMTFAGGCWELGMRVLVTEETECGSVRSLGPRDVHCPWPTPSARDWKDTPGMTAQRKDGKSRNDQLARRVYTEENTPAGGGNLNPDWVTWCMGWPLGWDQLSPLSTAPVQDWHDKAVSGTWWQEEPDNIPRVTKKGEQRKVRLMALGNGQVPTVAVLAWNVLSQLGGSDG
jgi:hypothetical protein